MRFYVKIQTKIKLPPSLLTMTENLKEKTVQKILIQGIAQVIMSPTKMKMQPTIHLQS
jgi:hypothetical protein